jgi:hypothetical protein
MRQRCRSPSDVLPTLGRRPDSRKGEQAPTRNPSSSHPIARLLALQVSDEHSLTPIIYPPTPVDTATRQKTLPCAGVFFR